MVAVAAVSLVAAGCGRSSKSSSSSSGSSTTAGASDLASGDFGTLKKVCGSGSAKGATDKGVTDTSINVATMSDPGNTAVPGLNQELFDSGDAFVGWCNDAGGINGRKIVLHKRDAALTNVAAKMVESCNQPDFMLVGNGEALDATGVQQRQACGLPEIPAYDVSSAAGSAKDTIMPIPVPNNQSNMGGLLRQLAAADPVSIKHYALINSTQQSIKDSGDRDRAAAEKLGYSTVHYEEAPIQVNNWRPYAENLKSSGTQVFGFQSNPNLDAALLSSLKDIGYAPKYMVLNANNYDPALISLGGAALLLPGGVYVNTTQIPFELADKYPAMQKYIGLLNKYVPNAKPKSLGISSFSAWLLWAEAAKACGSQLTRTCVMDKAGATTNWTGGGLHAPQKPGNATIGGSQCFVALKATPSGFVVDSTITKPNNDIFNCDPANAFDLPGFPKG
jgi:hypothetical protein